MCWHGPMVLRHRDFRWLWLGQLVSKLGSQFNYIALAWLVLQTTGSAVATGGVYLAQVLPNALFGWIAGVPVDRSDRRWLMIHADWLRGVLVLLLPLAYAYGMLSLPLIYAVTFLVSTLSLLFFAAEKSVVPLLVPQEDLTEANAWAEMTEQAGAFAGPVLAGVLLAALPSPVDLLYVDAASFLLSVFTLLAMGWRDPRQASPATAALVLQEAREGMVHLLKDPFLKVVFATAAAVNFLVAPFTVVFPILAERVLHAGSFGFGVLMTAFGGGMLAGSLAAGPLSRRFEAPLLIYGGMAWMGIFLGAMAAPVHLGAAAALGFLSSLGVGPANAVMLTLVQEKTPPELQGRVFASLFGLVQVAVPLGVGLAALLLDLVGPREVLAGMGAAIVLAAAVGRLALSRAGRTG